MNCPDCNAEATGKYCSECGTPLNDAACRHCDAPIPAGANFCTQCGERVRAASTVLPWTIAGIALAALLLVTIVLFVQRDADEPRLAASPTADARQGAVFGDGSAPGSPPPLTGTPREQADRLFDRVLRASAQGDTAQAIRFLPMAIAAYDRVGELDADGLYHLAILQTLAGRSDDAIQTADRILASEPDHILALGVAAEAARAAGDTVAARDAYEHVLRVFDAQKGRPLPEYLDHGPMLEAYREQAREFTGR